MKHEYETQQVKEDVRGRWERVLLALAPQLKAALERTGKHVPCPVHGGRDGFRIFPDVAETGGGICNTCGSFANGFALLMWINGWDFGRTIREVAEQVGSRSRSANSAADKSGSLFPCRIPAPNRPVCIWPGVDCRSRCP